MKVADVMTRDVMTCRIDDKLSDCAGMMRELNVGIMPVVDSNENLIGVITDRDITIRAVSKGIDISQSQVGEFFTPDPLTISPNINVEDAADIMADNQIRRLPVVDNGKLVGIVSLGDLAVDVGEIEMVEEVLKKVSAPVR